MGVVFLVSNIFTPKGLAKSTYFLVKVAIPESRDRKFKATRSPSRILKVSVSKISMDLPFVRMALSFNSQLNLTPPEETSRKTSLATSIPARMPSSSAIILALP